MRQYDSSDLSPKLTFSVISNPSPQAGAIVEVIHLTYNRALYFQLTRKLLQESKYQSKLTQSFTYYRGCDY